MLLQFAVFCLPVLTRTQRQSSSVWTWSTSQSCWRSSDSPHTNSSRWGTPQSGPGPGPGSGLKSEVWSLAMCLIRTDPPSLCVAAGEGHPPGGNQLGSGSSFSVYCVPAGILMLLLWKTWQRKHPECYEEILDLLEIQNTNPDLKWCHTCDPIILLHSVYFYFSYLKYMLLLILWYLYTAVQRPATRRQTHHHLTHLWHHVWPSN